MEKKEKKLRYGGWFEHNGYTFLAEGLIHHIYEKDGYIYKIVKEDRPLFHRADHFEKEQKILTMLRTQGFPVAAVERIFRPGELIDGFPVLQERKITDTVYDEYRIPRGCVDEIVCFLAETAKLQAPGFGVLYEDRDRNAKEYEYDDWDVFIAVQLKLACALEIDEKQETLAFLQQLVLENRDQFRYYEPARFLIMDPNPQNFFFDGEELTNAIDIDHPLGGDPLWQWACVCWYKPAWKENMARLGVVSDSDRRLLLYTALFGMANADFEIKNLGAVDHYTIERMDVLRSEIRKAERAGTEQK
ncbi:hypothetical protein V1224_07210 [Lachnospiraceae bacterium JLR.KK008]